MHFVILGLIHLPYLKKKQDGRFLLRPVDNVTLPSGTQEEYRSPPSRAQIYSGLYPLHGDRHVQSNLHHGGEGILALLGSGFLMLQNMVRDGADA